MIQNSRAAAIKNLSKLDLIGFAVFFQLCIYISVEIKARSNSSLIFWATVGVFASIYAFASSFG